MSRAASDPAPKAEDLLPTAVLVILAGGGADVETVAADLRSMGLRPSPPHVAGVVAQLSRAGLIELSRPVDSERCYELSRAGTAILEDVMGGLRALEESLAHADARAARPSVPAPGPVLGRRAGPVTCSHPVPPRAARAGLRPRA